MHIEVEKKGNNLFVVTVIPKQAMVTQHTVTLYPEYYRLLTAGVISEGELLRASFEFLLEKESNTSILEEFDLPDISRYFPDYEQAIKRVITAKKMQ